MPSLSCQAVRCVAAGLLFAVCWCRLTLAQVLRVLFCMWRAASGLDVSFLFAPLFQPHAHGVRPGPV